MHPKNAYVDIFRSWESHIFKKNILAKQSPIFLLWFASSFQNAHSKYASKSWTAHVSCRSKLSSAGWALLVQAIDVMPGTGDWYDQQSRASHVNVIGGYYGRSLRFCIVIVGCYQLYLRDYLCIWDNTGNSGSTLGYFRYHHGGKGLEAAVFYHKFYNQQGCPEKTHICLGVKCAEKEARWTHNFPHSPAWEIVPLGLLHFWMNPRQMVVGTSTVMLQPFSSICSSQQFSSLSLAV